MGHCACNCNAVYNKRGTKYPCVSGSCLTDTTLKIHTNSVTDNGNYYYNYYYYRECNENIHEVLCGSKLKLVPCIKNVLGKILEMYNVTLGQ